MGHRRGGIMRGHTGERLSSHRALMACTVCTYCLSYISILIYSPTKLWLRVVVNGAYLNLYSTYSYLEHLGFEIVVLKVRCLRNRLQVP